MPNNTRQIYGGPTVTRAPRRTTPVSRPNVYDNSRTTGNNTFRDMNSLGTIEQENQIRPHAQQRLQDFGTSGVVGGIHNQHAQSANNGMSEFDMLQAMLTGAGSGGSGSGGSGGGRSGGGSGGGSGRAAAISPELQAAFQQYFQTLQGRENPVAGYRERLAGLYDTGWLDQVFDPGRINTQYDAARTGVTDAGAAGAERLTGIGRALDDRTAGAQRAVAAAMQSALARQSAIGSDARSAQAADVANLDSILAANSAGSVSAEAAPLQALLRANQGAISATQGLFDQSMADRSQLSGQLQADIGQQMTGQEAALLRQIATQRAQALQQNELGRTQAEAQARQAQQRLDADLWLREQEAAAQQAAQLDEFRLRAAELGITL